MKTDDAKTMMGKAEKASTRPLGNRSPIATGSASTPKTNCAPTLVNSRKRVTTAASPENRA